MEFDPLLDSLGKILSIPLKADENQSCLIEFPKEKITLQLEMEQGTEMLILGSNIAVIPPGRYRQNLFEHALKANNLDVPKGGILAFSPKSDQLVLFLKIPAKHNTPDQIVSLMVVFKEKFIRWKEGLEKNELPQLVGQVAHKGTSSGMFGLK